MKRVKIWKPKLRKIKKGKETITEIVEKKHELISERSLMDLTVDNHINGGDQAIIDKKMYFEIVELPIREDDLKGKSRPKDSKC